MAMISFITCQSSMLRLPGSCCSTVTLTSFGISRAQVAKKTAGLVRAVEIIVCLPCEAQTSARSFKNPALNAVLDPTGLPFKSPRPCGIPSWRLRGSRACFGTDVALRRMGG